MYNETYLQHHGILGQKWGVRRYQNKDGSLTSKGRKRYWKQNRKEFRSKYDTYMDEFNGSKTGKELSNKYADAIKMVQTAQDINSWTGSDWDKFYTAEQNYLKAQHSYVANKLKNDYGSEELSILVSRGGQEIVNDGEKAVQAITNEWVFSAMGYRTLILQSMNKR